jgi:uncharacterized membrane protein
MAEGDDRDTWRTVGKVVAIVCGVAGLVLLGVIIFFVVAMNQWASNK